MARTAILTQSQCRKIVKLKESGARAVNLAKAYNVSESSLYKVLDGSYKARMDKQPAKQLPVVPVDKPEGITPSLFEREAPRAPSLSTAVNRVLEKACQIDDVTLDDVTVAAAELIVAKARLERALAHVH